MSNRDEDQLLTDGGRSDGEIDRPTTNPNASHAGIWSLDVRRHVQAGHDGDTDGVLAFGAESLPNGRNF